MVLRISSILCLMIFVSACSVYTYEVHYDYYPEYEDNKASLGRVRMYLRSNGYIGLDVFDFNEGSDIYYSDPPLTKFEPDYKSLRNEFERNVDIYGLKYTVLARFISDKPINKCLAKNIFIRSEVTKRHVLEKKNNLFIVDRHYEDKSQYECYFYDKVFVDTVGEDLTFFVDFDVYFGDGSTEHIQREVGMSTEREIKKTTFLDTLGGM